MTLWHAPRRATGARVARTVVTLERIAPVLPATVIASEDAHFCTHHGVDWGVIRDAIEEADDLSEARGGSTITQQLAKNLFLWGGRSYLRKALEHDEGTDYQFFAVSTDLQGVPEAASARAP